MVNSIYKYCTERATRLHGTTRFWKCDILQAPFLYFCFMEIISDTLLYTLENVAGNINKALLRVVVYLTSFRNLKLEQ